MKKVDIACVVDDDPIYIYGIKRMNDIAKFCNSLMIFNNGKDAYDKLKAILESGGDLPDMILLDINMPIWDGWQFLDEFTKIEIEKSIRVYIVSSSINPADIKKAKTYQQVSNFIVKPVSLENLQVMLSE